MSVRSLKKNFNDCFVPLSEQQLPIFEKSLLIVSLNRPWLLEMEGISSSFVRIALRVLNQKYFR